jgi:hypothetical protein
MGRRGTKRFEARASSALALTPALACSHRRQPTVIKRRVL